ncbi:unnamed protein product [Cuscuta epithymum]|uniref:DUF3615 domain-containing protein n=1 Tax=Cuscuta epithymum TaxID=186058 RepID=A0AAV0E471_9ASTE|nr:unnamed protein product [Cuscuta epithymum]
MSTEEKPYMDFSKSRFVHRSSRPYMDPSQRRFVPTFSVRHSPSSPTQTEEDDEFGTDVHHYCAKMALEYYNKKNRKRYELVEAGCSSGFLAPGICFHSNFKARPCRNTCGDGNEKTSTELFFAEIQFDSKLRRNIVNACRIIRGKTTAGCQFCHNDIAHPTHGFRKGLHRYEPRALRSNCSSLVDGGTGYSLPPCSDGVASKKIS